MKILIVNAGSSSLKYQLVDMQDESVLAKGLVERIGIPGSKLTQKYPGSDKKYVIEMDMPTHVEACKNMLSALTDAENGVVKSMDEIAREVIRGDWGNGADRRNRLTSAGYDYASVQAKVNELLG